MHFPHLPLVMARDTDLSNPQELKRICASLLGGRDMTDDYPRIFKHFIDHLPPADMMHKIVSRLWGMTTRSGSLISDFCWWDIVHHQRILVARVQRDVFEIEVTFMWRRTEKGTNSIDIARCAYHVDHTRRLCAEFEAPSYQAVKSLYAKWLHEPICSHWRTPEK